MMPSRMTEGDTRGRRLLAALCLTYLLGTAQSLVHPLADGEPDRCPHCSEGPSLVSLCEGGSCPAEHHHHPGRSPHHDAARCGVCQKHLSTAFDPAGAAGWITLSASRAIAADPASPRASHAGSHPPARAPPA